MLRVLLIPILSMVSAPKPAWIMTLPEFPGRVYGMGMASVSNTKALAIKQAQDGAKADVIARLRANIKSDTQIKTDYREDQTVAGKLNTTSASRSSSALTNVRIQTRAMDIPGLKVETTYLEEDRTNSTLYALAYLDVDVATQEVQARFDSISASLTADLGEGLRAKIHRTQILKEALTNLQNLEDLFGLIRAGGADPSLGEAILVLREKVERERTDLRTTLTFGMPVDVSAPLDADVRGVVRTAFLNEGLGWSDQDPQLSVSMRVRNSKDGIQTGTRWWDHTRSADFIMAQGSINLTLIDRNGQEYESALVVAKGVGANEFQADTLLIQDYKVKLTKTVAAWLADLGK